MVCFIMLVFWVVFFVFVNIIFVLYLGGLVIESLFDINFFFGIVGLVLYFVFFFIFGGLKVVVWMDVIQVIVLIIGGVVVVYVVLSVVGDGGFFGGISELFVKILECFDMVFFFIDIYVDISEVDFIKVIKLLYNFFFGISVLLGGMWIVNLYYWGNNQYII